jgi:hypothetical protein
MKTLDGTRKSRAEVIGYGILSAIVIIFYYLLLLGV